MTVVWLAMMAGVALYAVVAYVLVQVVGVRVQGGGTVLAGMLTWAASAAALVLGAGMVVSRRAEEVGEGSTPPERQVARYFTMKLVGLAIQEGAGFLVITLSLVAADGLWAVVAGIATIGVMSLSGPRAEHLDRFRRS
jgi:hypothetical protein